MTNLTVNGKKYRLIEKMGFNHSVGKYVAFIEKDGEEKKVVKDTGGDWRFWTVEDRISRGPVGRIVGQ